MTAEAWNNADMKFRRQLLAEIGATAAQRGAIIARDWEGLPKWAKRKLKALAHYFPVKGPAEAKPVANENS